MLKKIKTLILLPLSLMINMSFAEDKYLVIVQCEKCPEDFPVEVAPPDSFDGWTLLVDQTGYEDYENSEYADVVGSTGTSFMIYHSDDLYFIYNKGISNFDYSNSSNKIHYLSNASVVVNNNGVNISEYFEFRQSPSMSVMINSPSLSTAWCSITHGRYNGSCQNGNYGLGGWKIFEK